MVCNVQLDTCYTSIARVVVGCICCSCLSATQTLVPSILAIRKNNIQRKRVLSWIVLGIVLEAGGVLTCHCSVVFVLALVLVFVIVLTDTAPTPTTTATNLLIWTTATTTGTTTRAISYVYDVLRYEYLCTDIVCTVVTN